jgi:hypothetical protein
MEEEDYELPDEYKIDEPKGFKNLTEEQQREVIEQKKKMDKVFVKAIKENKGTKLKKRMPVLGRIDKKSKEDEAQDSKITGKYLLRDLPLFKYEIVIYAITGFVAFFVYILDKLGFVPGLLVRMVIPLILIPIAIWFVKWFFFMPNKKRVPHLKVYKSGVIELGITGIKKGYITYGSGEHQQKKFITRLNKHIEASTGKPFLITSELEGENLSLLEGKEPDMRSEEFNALLENLKAVTTKSVMNKMLDSVKPSLNNPMFLLIALSIGMIGVLIAKEFGIFEMIGA